jgi:hypothetical protein
VPYYHRRLKPVDIARKDKAPISVIMCVVPVLMLLLLFGHAAAAAAALHWRQQGRRVTCIAGLQQSIRR